MSFLSACNSKQTADQSLKDNNQRKDIIVEIAHHQPYMTEMMQEMMKNVLPFVRGMRGNMRGFCGGM